MAIKKRKKKNKGSNNNNSRENKKNNKKHHGGGKNKNKDNNNVAPAPAPAPTTEQLVEGIMSRSTSMQFIAGSNGINTVIGSSASDSLAYVGGDSLGYVWGTTAETTLPTTLISTVTGGAAYLIGGAANDSIVGSAANNTIISGSGNDTIRGGGGTDLIEAGAGNDLLVFENGTSFVNSEVNGGEGTNTLNLNRGSNIDVIEDGNFINKQNIDVITVGDRGSLVNVGQLAYFAGVDSLFGGTGNDTFSVDSTFGKGVTLQGNGGADSLIGGNYGDNFIFTSAANFTAVAKVNGGSGDDVVSLASVATNISLNDSAFANYESAGSLVLGSGSDSLTLGASFLASGFNSIDGGANNDSFYVTDAVNIASATINGGAGANVISFANSANPITLADSNFTKITNIQDVVGSVSAANQVTFGTYADAAGVATFTGGTVADSFTIESGFNNNLSITAGSGDDSFTINQSGIYSGLVIDGGSGTNAVSFNSTSGVTLTDSSFANLDNLQQFTGSTSAINNITFGSNAQAAGVTTFTGGTADDTFTVESGFTNSLTLNGDAGDNTFNFAWTSGVSDVEIIGNTTGTNTVSFSNASSLVIGDSAFASMTDVQKLVGGSGDNTITFGSNAYNAGISTIVGGSGANIFDSSANTGDHTFVFTNSNFSAGSILAAVNGDNAVEVAINGTGLTSAYTFSATNMTNVDSLIVSGFSSSVSLTSTVGLISVTGSTYADTFNATGLTSAVTLNGGGGNDVLIGSTGAANTFVFGSVGDLSDATITSDGLTNTISFADAASAITLQDSDFAGLTHITTVEGTDLAANTVTFGTNAQAAGVAAFDVQGGTFDNTFTVQSGFTNALEITSASGNDSFSIAHTNVFSGLAIDGGAGTNSVTFASGTNGVTLADSDFASLSNVQNLLGTSQAVNTISLGTDAQAAGVESYTVSGGTFANSFTVEDGFTNSLSITAANGNNTFSIENDSTNTLTLTSGSGNDTFNVTAMTSAAALSIDAGAGNNSLSFASVTNAVTITDSEFANIAGIQTLAASTAADNSITLGTNADAAGVATITFGTTSNTFNSTASVGDLAYQYSGTTTSFDTLIYAGTAGANSLSVDLAGMGGTDAFTFDASTSLTNVESLTFIGFSTSVTLDEDIANVTGSTYADTFDASTLGTSSSVIFNGGGGADVLTGGSGSNTFVFSDTTTLIAADIIGNTDGSNTVSLTNLTTSGVTIVDSDFAGMADVDTLTINNHLTSAITLGTDAQAAGLDVVNGGAGASTFTVESGFTNAVALNGGVAADTFEIGHTNIFTGLSIDGGTGASNTLSFADVASGVTITDAEFSSVSNIASFVGSESDVNTVTFGSNAQAAGITSVTGGSAGDTFSATSYSVDMSFSFDNTVAVTINAGTGNDTIDLTSMGTNGATITDSYFSDLTSIESLELGNGSNVVTLDTTAAAAGIESLTGGTGEDTLNAASFGTSGITLQGWSGTATSNTANDTLTGDSGTAGVDIFVIGANSLNAYGNLSNTLFATINNFDGNDIINLGGNGDIQVEYATNLQTATISVAGAAQYSLRDIALGGNFAGLYNAAGTVKYADIINSANLNSLDENNFRVS
jgi:hypothetical protein